MPEIIPEHVPNPQTPLVWDGTRYRAVRGHTDGTLQVRGEDQLFSYESSWATRSLTGLSGLNGSVVSVVVGPGQLLVLTTVAVDNTARATTGWIIALFRGGAEYVFSAETRAFAINEYHTWGGRVFMIPGDQLQCWNQGGQGADIIYLAMTGHLMTLET